MTDKRSAGSLTLWQKIGYGLGDIYGGGSGVVISFYYVDQRLNSILASRRAGEPEPEGTRRDAQGLSRLLIGGS